MTKQTSLHEVTRSHVNVGVVKCDFCGNNIVCAHEPHYYVDGVGAMCRSCLNLSHITFKGNRNFVTLTRTTAD